jgi:Zn-dependent protease
MRGSFKLFTVRGIPVRIHITFPLILVWAAIQFGFLNRSRPSLSGAAFGVVVTLLLFVFVVIHELAHSLTAIRMGFPVRDIVLLPLGGVSQMERVPERSIQEFLIAIAGPLSNGLLAGLLIVVGTLWSVDLERSLSVMWYYPQGLGWRDTLPYLVVTNVGLAAFNLIPAFPMDGGRVLRALLASVMSYSHATGLAVRIGQGLAWMMGLVGLLTRTLSLVLIAFMVYIGAAMEAQMTRAKTVLRGLQVRQAFSRDPQTLSPDDPISHAADLCLTSFQSDFPVCDREQIVGLLTYTGLFQALKQHRPETLVREVMRTDLVTIGPNDELVDAHQHMAQAGLDALPVVEGGHLLGLLTRSDVNEIYRLVSVSPELLTQRPNT